MGISKRIGLLLALIVIFLLCSGESIAQTTAQERADSLRLQLEELQTKQLNLQQRLQVLEEQSKPENIEKSLAGVGSTKPEDLRELKRRQFEAEKSGIQKQLNILAESKVRLEAGLAQANAEAYQQSAKGPVTTSASTSTPTNKVTQERPRRSAKRSTRPRRTRGNQ